MHIVRGLPDVPGQPARLYVLTHGARTVTPGDVANLEQGGIRGFMRAIGMEYPAMKPTQIDLDVQADVAHVAAELLSGSEEDETAWRSGEWFTARLNLSQLQPEERRTTVVRPETDGVQLQIRTPGDLSSAELAAYERVAPGQGQI